MSKRFYNAHAHCFTYDHVPRYFLTRFFAISWLLRRKWLRTWLRTVPFTGRFGLIGSVIKTILILFFGFNKEKLIRYMNFVLYGDRSSQEDVIKSMQQYYPASTGFVFLTMDMEFMGAGMPVTPFEKQLTQLEGIKRNPAWEKKIFPFLFCDPRRIQPQHKRETALTLLFTGNLFPEKAKEYWQQGIYHGIKLYPALGYFPFDKRLKPVYDFAVAHQLPCMTHCTIGSVHFKFNLDEDERFHPIKKVMLPREKPASFQQYFTHPLNYECLLNQQLLRLHWGEEAPDYQNLKICIGHWGTEEEWHKFIKDAWVETRFRKKTSAYPSLDLDNWNIHNEHSVYNFSWFSIICDLMRRYPNVYADISYTLQDASLLPLLKMILEADEKIKERVLFGTDFYLVSKAISEREFAINVRAALGKELFEQIAIRNTERYLNNDFYPMPLAW